MSHLSILDGALPPGLERVNRDSILHMRMYVSFHYSSRFSTSRVVLPSSGSHMRSVSILYASVKESCLYYEACATRQAYRVRARPGMDIMFRIHDL